MTEPTARAEMQATAPLPQREADFPEVLQDVLQRLFCLQHLRPGEVLFRQDEPVTHVYFLLQGRIVIERTDQWGNTSALCSRNAGDFFCPVSLFTGRYFGTARAVRPSLVLSAPKEQFLEIYKGYPLLREWAHRQCLLQVIGLVDRANAVMHYTVEQRLAWLLVQEAKQWGRTEMPRRPMELHLTQQELAHWIGATRETVSRILKHWKEQGWIQVRRGRLLVLEPEALETLLQGKQPALSEVEREKAPAAERG